MRRARALRSGLGATEDSALDRITLNAKARGLRSGLGGLAAFLRGLRFRNRPEFGWSVGLLHELA